ncbi:MAG: NAD(P)H-quinone oxidoreductase [Vicinamibacterales bacterium]
MRTVVMSGPGGPAVLSVGVRPTPEPGPSELLVRVEAAGVNRPDLMQRQGKYPPPPGASDILGLELAGTVDRVGALVERWKVGDRVCALVAGGAYAEYATVPEPQALPIPAGLDVVHAAAVPETYFTVWTNLFQRGRLQQGERVLVHGGTSGIGTTAIQLARAFGAQVLATAGSDDKCVACERLGAQAINYRTRDFVTAVRDLTNGSGVDVILDIVGGSYLSRNLECLAKDGRLVQIGLQGGNKTEINLATLMQRRLTLTGSTLRPRSVDEKGAIARELEAHVWPLLADGTVKPLVHGVYPMERAAEAHRALESGEVIGKVVLTM